MVNFLECPDSSQLVARRLAFSPRIGAAALVLLASWLLFRMADLQASREPK